MVRFKFTPERWQGSLTDYGSSIWMQKYMWGLKHRLIRQSEPKAVAEHRWCFCLCCYSCPFFHVVSWKIPGTGDTEQRALSTPIPRGGCPSSQFSPFKCHLKCCFVRWEPPHLLPLAGNLAPLSPLLYLLLGQLGWGLVMNLPLQTSLHTQGTVGFHFFKC